MTECACGGEMNWIEIEPVVMWEGFEVAGTSAHVCDTCGSTRTCELCGGRDLWQWAGPGQALWVCESCGDSDIALHNPPRPFTWKCSACGKGYYSFSPPPEQPVCSSCKAS